METVVKEKIDIQAQEAPAPQLPAIAPAHQERASRLPRQAKAPTYSPKIAAAILKITQEMEHVTKANRHDFHRYYYASWESINEKLSPLLAQHGLLIVQSEVSRNILEKNDQGSVLAIVYHFTIVNADGEAWPTIEWTAIARMQDQKGVTDDKAASKCHTSAEKFFCLKQFKIRTKDMEKGDANSMLPKKDARDVYTKLQKEINEAVSVSKLQDWGAANVGRKATLPPDWQDILTDRYNEKLAELEGRVIETVLTEPYDPDTGEFESAEGDTPADTPALVQPSPQAGAGDLQETLRLSAVDTDLEAAAKKGWAALKIAWEGISPADQDSLRAALNRRHKPMARAVDAAHPATMRSDK